MDTMIVQGRDIIALTAEDCPTDFEEVDQRAKRRTGEENNGRICSKLFL